MNQRVFASGWVLIVLFGLAACSTPRLSPEVRSGFDISGSWTLDPSRSDVAPDSARLVDQMDRDLIRGARSSTLRNRIGDGTIFAFIGQDFPVLLAERLTIEQSRESLGIRYEPGTYRDVSFGEKERGLWTISAGWDDRGSFVIFSDSDDIRATEAHTLLDASTLRIRLSVRADGGDLDLVRTFVKTP